jgi:hypothetical protein
MNWTFIWSYVNDLDHIEFAYSPRSNCDDNCWYCTKQQQHSHANKKVNSSRDLPIIILPAIYCISSQKNINMSRNLNAEGRLCTIYTAQWTEQTLQECKVRGVGLPGNQPSEESHPLVNLQLPNRMHRRKIQERLQKATAQESVTSESVSWFNQHAKFEKRSSRTYLQKGQHIKPNKVKIGMWRTKLQWVWPQ